MAINVSKQFEAEVEDRVRRGPYRSAEEFLRKSIARADEYRAQIRAAIEEGTAQAKRGELFDGEEVFEHLDTELAEEEKGA